MINLNDYTKEIDGVQYVPLKIAQEAVSEVYRFENYQTKLDTALADFSKAMNDLNSTVEDINKND